MELRAIRAVQDRLRRKFDYKATVLGYVHLYWGAELYIKSIDGFPRLKWLCGLDQFRNRRISLGIAKELANELSELIERVSRRECPVPPDAVQFYWVSSDGVSFGWDGLAEWLKKLHHLAVLGTEGNELWVTGD